MEKHFNFVSDVTAGYRRVGEVVVDVDDILTQLPEHIRERRIDSALDSFYDGDCVLAERGGKLYFVGTLYNGDYYVPAFWQEVVKADDQITVIVAECTLGNVHTKLVDNSLHELQKLVGGTIEVAHFPSLDERDILVLVNEEGVLEGLRLNDNFDPFFIAGWAVFVGTDGENFTSLTEEQIDYVYLWIGGLV